MFIKHDFSHAEVKRERYREWERGNGNFFPLDRSSLGWNRIEMHHLYCCSTNARCKTDFHYVSHHVKPLLAFTIHHAETHIGIEAISDDDDDIDGFWYYDVDEDDDDGDDERHFRPISSKHLLFFAQFSQCAFHKQIVSKTSVKCTKHEKCKKYGLELCGYTYFHRHARNT